MLFLYDLIDRNRRLSREIGVDKGHELCVGILVFSVNGVKRHVTFRTKGDSVRDVVAKRRKVRVIEQMMRYNIACGAFAATFTLVVVSFIHRFAPVVVPIFFSFLHAKALLILLLRGIEHPL